MRQIYKGHEITVKRLRCLGGWKRLYFTIVRESDGYICEDGGTDGEDTVRDYMRWMKERVDRELADADPWQEKGER